MIFFLVTESSYWLLAVGAVGGVGVDVGRGPAAGLRQRGRGHCSTAARAARLGAQEGALWAPPSVLLSARSAGELSSPPGRVREGL